MEPLAPVHGAKNTDPVTSRVAADNAEKSFAGTMQMKLLGAFIVLQEGTDEDAAEMMGLMSTEYTTRCAELRNGGLVEWTGETRKSLRTGMSRNVSIPTEKGLTLWETLDLPLPEKSERTETARILKLLDELEELKAENLQLKQKLLETHTVMAQVWRWLDAVLPKWKEISRAWSNENPL